MKLIDRSARETYLKFQRASNERIEDAHDLIDIIDMGIKADDGKEAERDLCGSRIELLKAYHLHKDTERAHQAFNYALRLIEWLEVHTYLSKAMHITDPHEQALGRSSTSLKI